MFSNIDNVHLILISFSAAFLMYMGIKLVNVKLKSFFGICIANEKTSLHHKPLIRGLGLIYIFALIPVFFINKNLLSSELILIVISTIIGFCDDKYGISQIKKLFILLLIIVFFKMTSLGQDNFFNFEFYIDIILFIFLTLFFNQIDGINGLAGSTFVIVCFGIFFLLHDYVILELIIPIICVTFIYLNTNLRGNIGIQGESGSFFMGSFIYILLQRFESTYDWIYVFIFLLPVISDVFSTTLIRLFYVKNLLLPHRNHLYQRLVEKYKSHMIVIIGFVFFQIISCYIAVYFYHLETTFYKLLTLSLYIILFFLINLRISYLIHKERF